MGRDLRHPPARRERTQRGGCDCGAVRYELRLAHDSDDIVLRGTELLVRAREFRLLSGEESLSGHQFANSALDRFYCERCGVCSFVHARGSDCGDFYAVDMLRLDIPKEVWLRDV